MGSGKSTTTLDNEAKILAWMESTGKPPSLKDIKAILGISDVANASHYLQFTHEILRERLERKLDEISDSLVRRIKERVEDEKEPMRDEHLIKLLEFVFPKKIEQNTKVEQTVNVESVGELKAELENYSKLFPATTDTPAL